MRIPVLIEKVAGNGFRAKGGEPFTFSVDAETRDEALAKIQQMIDKKIAEGGEIVELQVPELEHPLLRMAGALDPNDPMVRDWLATMAENRAKNDLDPDY
jgi:predicted RNase H-like HicB family nuclease